MALNTNDVLDLTKENIQPLRHGRKASQLKTALQAQIDPETQQKLHKQREQYEYTIRMYEGDDPLSPYYQYIVWLEQSFPKMGRESNLMSVIEDAIIKFKDYEKYKQDPRFVKLMIKYISAQSNPLELYQEVYGRGLGTMSSLLYKAWAEEFDKRNDFKRANQVFQRGINCRAEPLQELEDAHLQFQLSIARRMLEGNMNEVVEDSGRNVLSKLPSTKVKTNRCSKDSAGVFQSTGNKSDTNRGFNLATQKFKVFTEEVDNDDSMRDFKSKHNKLPKGSISDRENVMKASQWCGEKQKQTLRMPSTPATPSFPVHEDPEAECKTKMSVLRPRALKMKREDFNCPVAVFEPPDPTKIPMYPKQQVYVGGRDVQLEEIRAAYYWKKVKLEEEKRVPEQSVDMDVSEGPVDLTKSCNSSVDQRTDVFTQNINQICVLATNKSTSNAESSVPQLISSTANSFTLEQSALPTFVKPVSLKQSSESRTSVSVSRRSDAFMLQRNLYNRKSEYMDVISQSEKGYDADLVKIGHPEEMLVNEARTSEFEHCDRNTANQSDKFDSFGKLQKFEDDLQNHRVSDRNNISAFHHSPSTSITINTRAAMNVIQKMWESPLAPQVPRSQVTTDDFCESMFKMPMPRKSTNVCHPLFDDAENNSGGGLRPFMSFQVFTDDSIMSQNEVKKSNGGLPFPIFTDNDVKNAPLMQLPASTATAKSSHKLPFPVFSEEGERPENRKNVNDDELFDIPFTTPKITAKCAPFDEDLARPMGTLRMSEAEPRTPLPLIIPVNLQDTPLEPENKENQPPKDYSTPRERRPLSGILTPATDVPVRELNNSDDSDDDDNNYWQIHGRDHDFDESCNTKAFAIRLPSSTPSSRPSVSSRAPRRSSVYNGSYISEDIAGPSVTNHQRSYISEEIAGPSGTNHPASSVAVVATTSQVTSSKNPANLSLILENSKEQGSSSSSGHSANVVSKNHL